MKSTLFYSIFLLLILNSAFSQSFVNNKKVIWKDYEKVYSENYKLNQVKKIDDDLLVFLKATESLASNLNNFHFIDYNMDGNIDIIYTGNAGTETKRTLIFELDNDSNYIKTFDKYGELIELSSKDKLSPYDLILKENACCGGFSVVYEVFQQVYNKDTLELQASVKYSSINGTEFPSVFFDSPVLFEVKNELYYLRLNPKIDNETENEELHINGNIIGEYTSGAKGYAIAKKQDDTGRIWWFVFMLNDSLPLNSILDCGSNDKNKFYSFGWMSSKYLNEIK